MRLLAYSAYYEPETAASLYLSVNLYEGMAQAGIQVDLFVPMPSRGVSDEVRKAYRYRKLEQKCGGNLRIHRVWLPREGIHPLGRALRYVVMNLAFIVKGLGVDADAIFVQSTPPTQGGMAALIKKLKKIPLIYNLQDIFPDSLVSAGLAREDSLLCNIGRRLEDFTYHNADKILVISNDMKQNLISKHVPPSKAVVIPNWMDEKALHPVKKEENPLYREFDIDPHDFLIVYAGNLGYAQNIEVIVEAAERLAGYKDIRFLIFGKGAREEACMALAKNMEQVSFFPMQPYERVSYVYSLGDASVVPCKAGFGKSAMPSKLWSILACGTPVLASFDSDSELQRLVCDNHLGLFNEAEDSQGLADNILTLYHNRELAKEYGEHALTYRKTHVTREKAVEGYMEEIKKAVEMKQWQK